MKAVGIGALELKWTGGAGMAGGIVEDEDEERKERRRTREES